MIRFLGQAWLVIALSLVFGAALAGMQALVAEKIVQNKLNETLSQVPALVPGAESGEKAAMGGTTVYRALAGGKTIGWVVPAGGLGFGDRIEVLIGCDARGERLTGLYVLDQKETPGLGNKIADAPWLEQFVGKLTSAPLAVVKRQAAADSPEISSVTGATISSVAVCDIVNAALTADLRAQLAAAAGE